MVTGNYAPAEVMYRITSTDIQGKVAITLFNHKSNIHLTLALSLKDARHFHNLLDNVINSVSRNPI